MEFIVIITSDLSKLDPDCLPLETDKIKVSTVLKL